MDFICYKYDGWQPRIRPGTPRRAWMDATNERYAYRCLPLTMGNSHGWELLCPVAFEAKWDGGDHMEAVKIRMEPGYADHLKPVTLFGYGTMTWHIEAIFRTPPGWNLFVTGPLNRQKDAIQALGGMIETDWSPYTFTMNWRFTRPNQWIRFDENEPIAFMFPVQRGKIEEFRPRIERLEDAPELKAQFEKWSESRNAFQKWVVEVNPPAPADKWQKLYFRGLDSDGKPGIKDHQSKLRLPPFVFPDGKAMEPGEEKTCPIKHHVEPPPLEPTAAALLAAAQPANIFANPAGANAAAGNPALQLALGRLGLDAKAGQPALRSFEAAPSVRETDVALKRREWILDVQAKQRLVSPRNAEVERVRGLSRADFLDLHYALSRPVIIAGLLDDWPALERWTPDYLAETVGDAPVELQSGRDAAGDFELYKDRHKSQMPFSDYIAKVGTGIGNDLYMTAYNSAANREALKPLDKDVGKIDAYLTDGPGMMWIGPGGTFTPLHFDLTNNLIAQVVGTKHIIMAPPSETQRLYNHKHVFSEVHDLTDEARLQRFPLARGAQTYEFDLEAGDALFVPIGWWHQVTSLDFSVTLTYTNFRWRNDGYRNYPAD